MKNFKTLWMLIAGILLSVKGFGQVMSYSVNVTENVCDTVSTNQDGYLLDSVQLITASGHGTIVVRQTDLIYCPTQWFTGLDSVRIFACLDGNGVYYGCDTIEVVFNVQPVCSVSVALIQDSACQVSYRHYTASATGGAAPYNYLWSDGLNGSWGGVGDSSLCWLLTGFNLCITVTDANGCTASTCTVNNAHTLSFTTQVPENECFDEINYDPNTGYSLDSEWILTFPTHGIASYIGSQYIEYCPNANFLGADTMVIWACQYDNGVAEGCDTFIVYLDVVPLTQYYSFTEHVQENQCDTFTYDPVTGYTLSNFAVITSPVHGTAHPELAIVEYCPNQGFIGVDSMLLYACQYANGVSYGCDTFEVYLNVQNNCAILVNLTADSTCQGTGQHYTATAISGVSPFSYAWSDGSTGSGDCLLNGGNLCVTVTDANGCTGTTCTGNACVLPVTFTFDSACNGQPGVTVWVTSGTAPYNYFWSNGEDSSTLCGLVSGGYYCVDVTDANSCYYDTCFTFNGIGNCSFQYLQLNANSQAINFYGSYSNDTLVSATWNFGDGITGNGISPIHNYAISGSYYVTMNLYYTNGDSCSSSQYVYVYSDSTNSYPYCQAYFTSYVSGDTVYFSDQSSYNPTSWQWDFGDGTGSTLQNPYHVYGSQGSWTVCLTITTSGDTINGGTSCTSTWCDTANNVAVQDMQAYLFHGSTVTPGYPLYVYLGYYNNGTELMNDTVVYRYPAGTTLSYAYPTPIANDSVNRLLTFSYSGLLPGSSNYIGVSLAADSNIALGSLVYDTVWVYPITGDVTPANNISTIIDSVVGSWDPNGKSVSPKGRGEKGLIDASTPTVSYMVHFQNTGNAPAHQVIVRDTISDYIDLATVRVTYASFPHIAQVIGNELVVSFENINLPDTATSLLASQGYITVMANLKPGLAGGTQIFNTANIYFDVNAPVITNTVVNTLPGGPAGINNIDALKFILMPNPANSTVLIRGEFNAASTYELDDMLGQPLLKGSMQLTGAELNVGELSAGVYLVRVTSGDKTGAQRLVVIR